MPPSSNRPRTHSPAMSSVSIAATTGSSPDRSATAQRDFHLDTFFNPIWTAGPHVFSFASDGTVVRPETYQPEPYPGYHAGHSRPHEPHASEPYPGYYAGYAGREGPIEAPRLPSASKDPKPWKNVAISEQDEAEYQELMERARVGALGEWRDHAPRELGSAPPYLGHSAGYAGRAGPVDAPRRRGKEHRKNAAIAKQDEAEFKDLMERARVGNLGEWQYYSPYELGRAPSPSIPGYPWRSPTHRGQERQ